MPAKKPLALKLLSNTVRPCRERDASAALPAIADLLPAPDWLTAEARAEYKRVGKAMLAVGTLNTANASVLAGYAALTAWIGDEWRAGRVPPAAQITAHRQLATSLGLCTPMTQRPITGNNRFANHLTLHRSRS